MRKTSPSVLCLLLALTASAGPVASQGRRVPGDIRVSVTEVPVNVIVVDRRNRPVLDLKKEDFLVFEDNVPQEIVHFSVESYAPRQETSAAPLATTPTPATENFGTTQHRTFLIVMGRGRHELFDTIPQLIDFVREGLQPTDRVAFMVYNRATDFVTDHRVLVPVIERYGEISPAVESKIETQTSGLGVIFGRSRSLSGYRREIDRIFDSEANGSRSPGSANMADRREQTAENRELIETTTRWEGQRIRRQEGECRVIPLIDHGLHEIASVIALDWMTLDRFMGLRTAGEMDEEALMAAIEYMRHIDGEKHIIFLNDQGVALARADHEQGLAARASDARVRLHAVQTGGVWRGRPGAGFNSFALQSMKRAAGLTGGQSFSHSHVSESLQHLEEMTAASYLLGYVPPNTNPDGRFRRIEVKVVRPGLRAMHRRGYHANQEVGPWDRRQFLTFSRTAMAAGSGELFHDVDLDLEVRPLPGAGRNTFRTRLTVRPATDLYVREGDHYVGEFAVSYFLFDRSGNLRDETWGDLRMTLGPERYSRVVRDGFPIEMNLQVPSELEECLIRAVVYDPVRDRIGSADVTIELRP
jgi:VWFA-related protein